MHVPKNFKQDETEALLKVIQDYPFATLVAVTEGGLNAHHLPFSISDAGDELILKGHIARVNPLWKNLTDGAEVLLVFHGPNCYISPSHYPTKQEHGKAVPTWNYVVVHVRGELTFMHDSSWNLDMLHRLTNQHEAGRTNPWSVSDAPQSYTASMLRGIVGLEIVVSELSGQWKLSQNQPEKNRAGVVAGLLQEGDRSAQAIAALIRDQAL